MQRSANGSELAERKVELRELLSETLEHHKHCNAARGAVENAQQLAIFHAWQAGIRLNKMKAIIGHGSWTDWLEDNFCKPRGVSYQTAVLYMKIDNDNPHVRALRKPNLQRVRDLKFDTIRKYAIGFVPEKEQPEHEGNIKFERLVSFLNIVNEYNRVKYRHTEGLQRVDVDEVREETPDLYQFLRWVHGDRPDNPWDKAGPPTR